MINSKFTVQAVGLITSINNSFRGSTIIEVITGQRIRAGSKHTVTVQANDRVTGRQQEIFTGVCNKYSMLA